MSKPKWNSPPNWPTPPAWWSPPAGWQPDPAWGPAPPGWQFTAPRKSRTGLIVGGCLGGAILLTIIIGVSVGGSETTSSPPTDTTFSYTPPPYTPPPETPAAEPSAAAVPPTPPAAVVPASPARRAASSQTLLDTDQHFRTLLNQGTAILLSEAPYPDANAGLQAMDEPGSAAARFSAFQVGQHPENDEATQMTAFQQADAVFTAADEPAAISTWRDTLGQVDGAFAKWEQVAGSYQISEVSRTDLDAAASAVSTILRDADLQARLVAKP